MPKKEGSEAYVIQAGQVDVLKESPDGDERIVLATLRPGDIVGEMALITGEARSASVVAKEDTRVQLITLEQMKSELKKQVPWMEQMVTALARRLGDMNSRVLPGDDGAV